MAKKIGIKTTAGIEDYASLGGSGSGGGHTIIDSGNNELPQRSKLKFLGATVTDSSGNDTTIIDIETGTIIVQIPTITNNSFTYNGTEQGPTITWSDPDMANHVVITNAEKVNVGTYTLTIALKNTAKMVWSDMTTVDLTYSWSIGKATIALPAVSNTSKTYNGSVQSPTIATYDTTKLTVSGNSATNAGNYMVVFTLVDSDNYQMSGTNNVAWSIAKATSAITINSDSVTLDGDYSTANITVGNVLGRTLSVSSSDTTVATASVSGSTVTISNVNQTSGTATITITAAQSTNYNASSKTVSVTADFVPRYSWSSATDVQIQKMLDYCDAKNVTLYDLGWRVGDERTVHLAGNVNEDVIFIIEDINNTTSGGTSYHAAVGQKNGLSTTRQMNSSNTNSGGYNSSAMKTFIEGDYQTALQNATTGNFWEAVKSATHKSQIYSSGLQSTTAKVILHSIFEFCSSYTNAGDETTANGFHQFSWYTTTANRIKTQGEGGSAYRVWTRSAYTIGSGAFCNVRTAGNANDNTASDSYLAAPFCVI